MQCKDIPDRPILEYIGNAGQWVLIWRMEPNYGLPYANDAMPEGTPYNLVRAKMARLIKRGLVSGCTCGCRGDFELTAKGWEAIK